MVRPEITQLVEVVVHVCPSPLVAVYPEIGLPPEVDGANQAIVIEPFPGVAVTPVGAPGAVAGVAEYDAVEAEEVPAAFVAVTEKV